MGEFIAVDQAYQNTRLAFTLFDWGCRQADEGHLWMYGDASMKGLPVWRHYGCEERGVICIPARLGCFETYEVVALVRALKLRGLQDKAKL